MLLRKLLLKVTLLGLISSFYGCGAAETIFPTTAAQGESKAIILTDVDFDPESLIPETQPVADYLGDRLKRSGITEGEVKIAPDVETVAQWMASGEVNVYFDSVYPAMLVMKKSGARPILRRWKDGVAEYSTYIVAPKNSGLSDIQDLEGKMIALEIPSSSSGFMFPMVAMLEAGLNPVEKAEANHAVAEDEVGYIFSGDPENTVEWILEGRVAAGAIDDETWSELSDSDKSALTIVAETKKFPRHVVLVGPSLDAETVEALKAVMLEMDGTRKGQAALAEFSETAKFDEFPEGAEAAIAQLEAAYDKLQTHLAQ